MYYNRLIPLLSAFYPELAWSRKTDEKVIYLTFDDGPIPGVTEYVLDELGKHGAKATFFCVGDNISKHPEVFKKVIASGNKVGNHTYNHLKGWNTENENYTENILKSDQLMSALMEENQEKYKSVVSGKKLFRPPYGKIKKSQIKPLQQEYEIIMWDVLTGDFNKDLPEEKCLQKAIRYTRKGSIVIFHDSIKAEKNLKYALPRYLEYYLSLGYTFKTL